MSGRAKNPPMTAEQISILAEPTESRMYQGKGQTAEVNRQLVCAIVGDMAVEMEQAADESRRFPLSDLQSVERIARQYVVACANKGSLPSVSGLAAALGRTRTAVYKYANEHQAFADFLTDFSDRCGEAAAQAAIVGATQAVPTIFLLKSRFGFREAPTQLEIGQLRNDLCGTEEAAVIAEKYLELPSE